MSENYFASKYSSICWSLVKKLMCISNNIQRQNYKWTFKIKSLFFSPKVQKCGSNEMVLHLFYWYCFRIPFSFLCLYGIWTEHAMLRWWFLKNPVSRNVKWMAKNFYMKTQSKCSWFSRLKPFWSKFSDYPLFSSLGVLFDY